jgi:hypothetical protein
MPVTCSSCGSDDHLNLVTLLYDDGANAGRVLVYCRDCQAERRNLGLSIPIEMVDEDLFVDLYTRGFTESDPEMAVAIVFGGARPDVAARAAGALRASRRKS